MSPSDEFSPIPFWFLNDTLEKTELKRQIDDFYSKGIRGFVIHPRKGLPLTQRYLSETFLDHVEFIVEEAAHRKMTVFLYDEAMYPSGAANGMVVKANPAYAAKGLQMLRQPISEPAPIFGEGNWFVASIPLDEEEMCYFSLVYSEGTIRGVHEGEDDREPNAPKAADLLDINAMKLFIHLTHDTYYERLKKYFGSTIVAMFTDEPDILGRNSKKGLIPWTHRFLEHYLECGGKVGDLPILFEQETTETHEIHTRYRHAVNSWMCRSYFEPISQWCTAHGIALSGHPHESNDIGFLKYFQIPCQDMVWRYVDPDMGNSLVGSHSTMGKCSSDSARHRGRRRNGNECFGACGQKENPWDFTSSDMKWYLDWLFVRGVNLIIPHAYYYSLRDDRVNERPPDVGPNSIWWNHYEQISSYIKRMCWLNTDSYNVTDVAVLCSSDYLPWKSVKMLYEHQIEFNYLEAELLEQCSFVDRTLKLEKQNYRVILIEEGLFLTEKQQMILDVLIKKGLTVFSLDPHKNNAHLLKKLAEYNPLALKTLQEVPDLRVTHIMKQGRHCYLMTNEGNDILYFHGSTALEGKMELWNPWDGTMEEIQSDDMLPFCLGYRESRILVVTPAQPRNVPWQKGELVRVDALSSQTRRFTTEITVDKAGGYSAAEITHFGEIVTLSVDNVKIGTRMWPPYRFNVAEFLAAGTHTIEIEVTEPMVPDETKKPPNLVLS